MTDNGVLQYRQDYVSGIEYRYTTAGGLTLEAVYHSEGRVYNNGGTLRYEYSIRDHLGNTRLTFTDKNANGVVDVTNTSANEILQENHFYPFGLDMAGPWMNDAVLDNQYKYNGKELNGDFGLNWMDYGARWYDASVGRWWNVDLMADVYTLWSPYNYGLGSPVQNSDPDGMSVKTDVYLDEDDKVIKTIDDGKKTKHYYRAQKEKDGKITVSDDLGTDYVSKQGEPLGDYQSWMTIAQLSFQSGQGRTSPPAYLYNFADKTPVYLANVVEGLFLIEGIFEVGGSMLFSRGEAAVGTTLATKGGSKLLNQHNTVESLIRGAGNLTKVKGGIQGFVKGDGAAIFKSISHGGVRQSNGTIIMPDGTTLFNHLSTKTGVYTIDINKAGQIYKIRITP